MMNRQYNNFSPRRVFDVKKDGTVVQKDYITPGQDNWDQVYREYEVKDVVKPIEGSDDFVIEHKIIWKEKSIKDVLASQASQVGLDNMIKKFELTGDPSCLPSSVKDDGSLLDLTQLPSDEAEYFNYIHGLQAAFESLPIDLRKDMSVEDFIRSVQQKDIDAYFYAKKAQLEKDKKGDGSNE